MSINTDYTAQPASAAYNDILEQKWHEKVDDLFDRTFIACDDRSKYYQFFSYKFSKRFADVPSDRLRRHLVNRPLDKFNQLQLNYTIFPLHVLAFTGNYDFLRRIEQFLNLTATFKTVENGNNVLHYLIEGMTHPNPAAGPLNCLNYLLHRDDSLPKRANDFGKTPLDYAEKLYAEHCALLSERRAELTALRKEGAMALMEEKFVFGLSKMVKELEYRCDLIEYITKNLKDVVKFLKEIN